MRLLLGALVVVAAAACTEERVREVVLHRSACEVCHRPLGADEQPHGLEVAHPWAELSCVGCHGGADRVCDGEITEDDGVEPECDTGWIYDQERSHVSPGDGPTFLRNLAAAQLDEVDRDYLQFVNPGDFRVLDRTCGKCHVNETDRVTRSTMAHTAGEVAVARYRAGAQDHPRGIVGGKSVEDPERDPSNTCSVDALEVMNPPPVAASYADGEPVPTVAELQDQYMVKSCFRCHLNDFGENRFPGDFRSSGCTACHMNYSDDGLSESADPRINKLTVPHPVKHEMTTAPTLYQCTHCHYRGGRLGIGYQGYRESSGPGLNPPDIEVLGQALHGHDAAYYLTDEDTTNDFDETPPDVHFEAGMHCVDCHILEDVHGDGHIYADTQCAVKTRCTDCHGTVRERAKPHAERPHVFERDGRLWLRTKLTGKELEIVQVTDTVDPSHPRYTAAAAESMGVNDAGFSHTDEVACYTCHASWMPSCYGCHVTMDMSRSKAYHTTGAIEPGAPAGRRRWVQLNDLVLMRDTRGLLSPSMPSERFFMTLVDADEETIFEGKPRTFTFPDGRTIAGFGQRTFNPHTTRSRSAFQSCDRCHSAGSADAPSNEPLLDITHGFGTERFMQEGCNVANKDPTCDKKNDWTTYALDALITRDGEPLVVVGHPDPTESRPLTLEEIERMRAVVVPADHRTATPIPADARTNPNWPAARAP